MAEDRRALMLGILAAQLLLARQKRITPLASIR
jgi:hypothetical protein